MSSLSVHKNLFGSIDAKLKFGMWETGFGVRNKRRTKSNLRILLTRFESDTRHNFTPITNSQNHDRTIAVDPSITQNSRVLARVRRPLAGQTDCTTTSKQQTQNKAKRNERMINRNSHRPRNKPSLQLFAHKSRDVIRV